MKNTPLLTGLTDRVFTITLNRPDRLNAFNRDMQIEMLAALDRANADDVGAVILTGAGRGFCAGQDLDARNPDKMSEAPDLGETIEAFYNPCIRALRELQKPVVCAVNGVAAGAGANIAFACDIVLAAQSAKFIEAFSRLGLVPDSGGTWTLTRAVGEMRAKAMTLLAEPISAEQAQQWGLVWKVVSDAELAAAATIMATQLARGPTLGLGLTKLAIQYASTYSLDESLDIERDFQRQAGCSADYAEGVRAFLAKRAPNFIGR